jgi:cytochrome B/b6, N
MVFEHRLKSIQIPAEPVEKSKKSRYMKKIITFLKTSNRYKHLVGGLMVGLLGFTPLDGDLCYRGGRLLS